MYMKYRNLDEHGKITLKAYKVIQECLLSAYKKADFLFQHKDEIYIKILFYEETIKKIKDTIILEQEDFKTRKITMKRFLKTGKIPDKAYCHFLQRHKNSISNLEYSLTLENRKILEEYPEYKFSHITEHDITFVKKYFE